MYNMCLSQTLTEEVSEKKGKGGSETHSLTHLYFAFAGLRSRYESFKRFVYIYLQILYFFIIKIFIYLFVCIV